MLGVENTMPGHPRCWARRSAASANSCERGNFAGVSKSASLSPRQLRWILRRLGEVFVGHLRIVLGHNGLTVTDPRADDVHRVGFRQFGLPGATGVLPQLGPRRQPSPLDDLLWLGPQVGIIASIAGDYPFGARFGLLL